MALHRALISARAASMDLDAFLAAVLETLRVHLRADGVLIGLCDPESRDLARVASSGNVPPVSPGLTLATLPCFCPSVDPDRHALAVGWAEVVSQGSVLQVLGAAALAVRDDDIGIVCLFGLPDTPRTPWHQEGLAAAALEIGLATAHLRLRQGVEERLRERNERWSALYELAVSLTRVMDSDQLLDELVQRTIRLLRARGGSLSVIDKVTGEVVVTVAYRDGAPAPMIGYRLPPGKGLSARVMQSGQTLHLPEYVFPEGAASNAGLRTALIAVPLFVQGVPAAVLAVGDDPAVRQFTRDDIETVELLAQAGGAILEKVHGRMREQALTIHRERSRLASELHDGLAQNLASLLLKAELCHDLAQSGAPQLAAELDTLADGLQRAIRETRGTIASLHDSASGSTRLLDALRLLATQFEEQVGQRVEIVCVGDEERRLSAGQHTALVRLAQEALTNVRKHANATRVCVYLNASCQKTIELSVQDNGNGFDLEVAGARAGHFGIVSMRSRMEELGGLLRIDSKIGSGTTVTAVLPLGGGQPGD